MPRIRFGRQLVRQLGGTVEPLEVEGASVSQVLDAAFARLPAVKGYVVDEQGRLRRHVAVFIDNEALVDREELDVAVQPTSEVYVLQAQAGG